MRSGGDVVVCNQLPQRAARLRRLLRSAMALDTKIVRARTQKRVKADEFR
jgi:hypothetical protein